MLHMYTYNFIRNVSFKLHHLILILSYPFPLLPVYTHIMSY